MDRQPLLPAEDVLRFFPAALEQVSSGVILFDDQNTILYFNRAMELISGWPREQALGRNLGMLAPEAMRARYDTRNYPGASNRVQELAATPHDIQLVRRDGSTCWISTTLSQVTSEGSDLRMVLITDVTARREAQARERLLSLGFDETQSAVLITDPAGCIEHANKGFRRLFGFLDSEAAGQFVPNLLAPGRHEPEQIKAYRARLQAGQPIRADERLFRKNGQPLWCSVSTNPIFDDYGKLVNLVIVLMDITRTKVHEVLQHKMLDAMVREVPTVEVMQMMCTEVEKIAPQVLCSVLRVDDGKLRTLAAPSLPDSYNRLVDGVPVGPRTGSCGTAAYTGETVVARDIATDPNWEGISALALQHGLAACWSTPIKSNDGRVLGTFAFYYRQPHEPDSFHRRLVEVIVHLCALALEREEARNRIRRLAFYDDLTGLPNRSLLHAQAEATTGNGWRCCSSTWTASNRSTTLSATPVAMSCCAPWHAACRKKPDQWTSLAGCPATSSWCCSTPATWPPPANAANTCCACWASPCSWARWRYGLRPASASACSRTTATTWMPCSTTPMWRCTRPSTTAATGCVSTAARWTSARRNAWRWRPHCARHWNRASCSCTTNPRSTSRMVACTAWRHWRAGITRGWAACRRSASFHWLKKPG